MGCEADHVRDHDDPMSGLSAREIAPGLWLWQVAQAGASGGQVASLYAECPKHVVLVDPVLPSTGTVDHERFLGPADRSPSSSRRTTGVAPRFSSGDTGQRRTGRGLRTTCRGSGRSFWANIDRPSGSSPCRPTGWSSAVTSSPETVAVGFGGGATRGSPRRCAGFAWRLFGASGSSRRPRCSSPMGKASSAPPSRR